MNAMGIGFNRNGGVTGRTGTGIPNEDKIRTVYQLAARAIQELQTIRKDLELKLKEVVQRIPGAASDKEAQFYNQQRRSLTARIAVCQNNLVFFHDTLNNFQEARSSVTPVGLQKYASLLSSQIERRHGYVRAREAVNDARVLTELSLLIMQSSKEGIELEHENIIRLKNAECHSAKKQKYAVLQSTVEENLLQPCEKNIQTLKQAIEKLNVPLFFHFSPSHTIQEEMKQLCDKLKTSQREFDQAYSNVKVNLKENLSNIKQLRE
jgi:hypothetical protein